MVRDHARLARDRAAWVLCSVSPGLRPPPWPTQNTQAAWSLSGMVCSRA